VVKFNLNNVLANVLERNSQVTEVLDQLAAWTLNGDGTGLDANLDTLRDGQGLF